MTESLIHALVSNLVVAVAIVCVTHVVHATRRYPAVAHVLWVLALFKLMTPPWLHASFLSLGGPGASGHSVPFETQELTAAASATGGAPGFGVAVGPSDGVPSGGFEVSAWLSGAADLSEWMTTHAWVPSLLAAIWLLGALCFAVVPLMRVRALHRLLQRSTVRSSDRIGSLSREVASAIGLRRVPVVQETIARIAPFTWAVFGPARVIVPRSVVESLDDAQLRAVLLHEFTHVQRGDPLVRWLEWAVVVVHWWNPIAWWVRHRLRIDEELACDAHALAHARVDRRNYANSLLSVAECLVTTDVRPPVLASGIDSGGTLERRIKMIAFGRIAAMPRGLRLVAALLAVVVLPMSFARAQDFRAVERRLGAAIEAGELSIDQARIMMDALRRSVASQSRAPKVDSETKSRVDVVRDKLALAVREGKISKEDARRKLTAFEEALRKDQQNEEMKLRAEKLRWVKDELREAVKRGDLSEKEAELKLRATQERVFSDRVRSKPESDEAKAEKKYADAVRRIKEAVKDGKLDEAQAETKLHAIHKSIYEGASEDLPTRLQKFMVIQDEIKAAVREGRMDKSEAKRKLADLQMSYFGGANQDRRK
ncbi:MAG: hypothetical protein KDC95_20465 [Planctomycetes bacterium]|nr:hypothetical protein [Planctomycetota bacterium]